jgi:sulfide:quinone oxidoreductase
MQEVKGMGRTVLILGGGTGGVVAGHVLAKVLPKTDRVALVDRSAVHLFRAGLPLVVTGRRRPEDISRSLDSLEKLGVQFIQAEVEEFIPENKAVRTDQGFLSYDSLIIALGAEQELSPGPSSVYNPYDLQGAQQLAQELAKFRQGEIVLFISGLPFPGAIAPYEIALLVDAYFRRRGLRRKIRITFVTPESRLLEFASPYYSKKLRGIMEKRGIRILTGRQVHSLAKGSSLVLSDGDLPGDLFIGIPRHRGPSPIRGSIIADPSGWLIVDPTTLSTSLPDVYAIGDAAGIRSPAGTYIPKVGFFAHYQAEVVARNLALSYANKKPRFRFVGGAKGASMLASFRQGCFVSADVYATPPKVTLSSPNPLAYLTKMLFERYWLKAWF